MSFELTVQFKYHMFSHLIDIELVLPPRQLSVTGSEFTNEVMAARGKKVIYRHASILVSTISISELFIDVLSSSSHVHLIWQMFLYSFFVLQSGDSLVYD